jgi:death-on-curing protein
MPPTVYLTVDQIKELHHDAIAEFGGLDGVRSEQQLFSAVAQVQQSAFGEDAYPTIADKAAAYGYFLSQNHPFIDGNKRAGLATMLTFLDLNDYEFDESEDERARMFEEISSGAIDQSEFFSWVRDHARPSNRVVDR